MFAGIGGFRAGLSRVGGFQCVGHCEIDKYADASYRAIHKIGKEERYYQDARKIDPGDLPDFDLLCGGFPCQAFSHAGRRQGFNDARGTLFFEISRLAQAKRPPYLLLENVPGLLSHDKGRTFGTILSALDDLGYHVEWSVLNSKYFGVSQSRRRLFIICYLDPRCAGKILPVFGTDGKALIQILRGPQGLRVYGPEGIACTPTSQAGGMGRKTGLNLIGFNRKVGIVGERDTALALNASDFRGINRNQTQNAVFVDLCNGFPRQTEIARCLTADYGKARISNRKGELSGVLLIKEDTKCGYKEAAQTGSTEGIIMGGGRIRRLMPKECLRLQGFADDQIDQLLAITSDTQAYKQAGNSVTVNVIAAIGKLICAVDYTLKK